VLRPRLRRLRSGYALPAPPQAGPEGIRVRCVVLVLGTGFMVFGLPYPVSKEFGGGIGQHRGCAGGGEVIVGSHSRRDGVNR
jgi:hypothetical protein